MTNSTPVQIIIVDDHAVVRQGLRMMLDAQPDITVIAEAPDGQTAVNLARSLHPDLILLDLLMPEMDGIETIQHLREAGVESKILVLTSSLEDEAIKQALKAGAQGYLLKASRSTELVRAIQRVIAGEEVLDPAAAQALIRQVRSDDPLETLTGRERDVFDLLARGQTNSDIAASLHISEVTVRTHIMNIFDKLDVRDRTQIMIYALKRGLVHLDDLP